jgi:diguanylate cyclase (GGDEF)-like protein/PAS domain S-box-containing protein
MDKESSTRDTNDAGLDDAMVDAMVDDLPALISRLDLKARYLFANRHFAAAHGLQREQIIGRGFEEIHGAAEYAAARPQLEAAMSGSPACFETRIGNGAAARCYKTTYLPCHAAGGRVCAVLAMSVDITEYKKKERRLTESQTLLNEIADNLPVLISYIDKDQKYRFCNATFEKWLGVKLADIVNRPVREALGNEVYEERREFIERALSGERVEFELESHALGLTRHQRTVYTPHRDSSGAVLGIYTISSDISALKAVERQLTALARFDSLTGLPNRHQLNEKLNEAVERARRNGKPLAVMFLDVDRFKTINDTLGHAQGDKVLQAFGRCLSASVRITDTVARLAGDEFVIILEGVGALPEAEAVADKIIAAVNQDAALGRAAMPVSTSIGIAFSDCRELNAQQLLVHADRALYQAKNSGRNTRSSQTC